MPTTTDIDRHESKDELDRLFGLALPPARVDPLETVVKPRSLTKLDGPFADRLDRLMRLTAEGFGPTQYVYGELPILWLVDGNGDLWFAIEEIVDALTGAFVWPRLRHAPVGAAYERLGHPSLIQGQDGRIWGEILFDLGTAPPAWFLTNGSGRYGLIKERKPEHLSNACRKFAGFGIVFREFFIPVS